MEDAKVRARGIKIQDQASIKANRGLGNYSENSVNLCILAGWLSDRGGSQSWSFSSPRLEMFFQHLELNCRGPAAWQDRPAEDVWADRQ